MSKLNGQFYRDNSPNFNEFRAFSSIFDGLTEVFDDIMSQATDNSKVATMRAFTKIPIQIINVVDACYSLSTLLTNKEILNITKINPSLSIQERMDRWNELDPKIRAEALDQLGLVLMLVNPNILKSDNIYTDTFKVVDFEMYDYNTGDRLIYGLDYYYEYNKIYFLRFGSQTNKYNNKKIILKNITIDNNMPEKIIGESLGIYANSNFSPTEYRDIVASFVSAALAGPVINKINQSFNPDTELNLASRTYGLNDEENSMKGIKVIDYKSADKIRKRFWDKQTEGINKLNAFDFLVTIPSDYLYKSEKMEYIQGFMKKIKPAQSNFVLCPEYSLKDILSMRHSKFSFHTDGEMTGVLDKIKHKEKIKLPTSYVAEDEITLKAETYKQQANNTHSDYLNLKSASHEFDYNSSKGILDTVEYLEDNAKIAYLDCLTKVHVARNTYHISDEVLLDTDYFDCIVLLDNFTLKVVSDFKDIIPPLKTNDFKMTWMKPIHDTRKFKEKFRISSTLDFSEMIALGYKYQSDVVVDTDSGYYLDTMVAHDYKISQSVVTEIQDNIREHADSSCSLILNANSLYDKISNIEKATKYADTQLEDKVTFSQKANLTRCDFVINCDYEEEENSFYLDGLDKVDNNALGYEAITLKLIPKN